MLLIFGKQKDKNTSSKWEHTQYYQFSGLRIHEVDGNCFLLILSKGNHLSQNIKDFNRPSDLVIYTY